MADFKSINIDKIKNFITDGIKNIKSEKIGVECEHFILDKNNNAVSFYGENGVEAILNKLSVFYNERTYSGEYLVGLNDGQVFITLEPASQIEVSIVPLKNIEEIEELYKTFFDRINNILAEYEYKMTNCGYNPSDKADDLILIPKQRYEFMDSYFLSLGNKARYMMRGSASVQINIDYFSETDFIKKLKVANVLTPLFYLITDNAEFFEGKKYSGYSARSLTWENVDNSRCGCVACDSFEDYAKWLYSTNPIFIIDNNKEIFCGLKSNEKIFENKQITEDEIKHILSMVFPNVRVKQFIEIRAGDSMPCEYMMSYASLIKGLFYNTAAVDYFYNLFIDISVDDINLQIKRIRELGYKAKFYNFDFSDILEKIFDFAENTLCDNEKKYLDTLKNSALNHLTPKELLKAEVVIK